MALGSSSNDISFVPDFADFGMPRYCLELARLRIVPDGVTAAFSFEHATV